MNGSTIGWEEAWKHLAGLPPATPQWIVAMVALAFISVLVVVPGSAVFSYLDRKLTADLQARVGPNRAGPAGLLQSLADLLKLLQKENRKPSEKISSAWFAVQTMALYSTLAFLPLGSVVILVDTEMSVFLPFWATLVLVLGTMLLGLSQKSVPGWFGGIRLAVQTLTGSFPALVAILCAGIRAGGFRWSILAQSQGASPLSWAVFSSPFSFLAFLVFTVSGLIMVGVAPLDGGFSQPDIHGGVASHVFGRRLSLFKLGKFYGFFLWSVIAAVLFLGGWTLPEFLVEHLRESDSWRLLQSLEVILLLIKTFLLMIFIVMVGCVTPRLRSDQVTELSWKVLGPFGLFALAGTAIWAGWKAML